jgi:hypothetical protein
VASAKGRRSLFTCVVLSTEIFGRVTRLTRQHWMTLCLRANLFGVCVLASALIGADARAEEGIPLKLGKEALGLHVPMQLMGKTIYGQVPDEHFVFMVEDALEKLKREKNILVLSVPKLKNGLALMTPGRKRGNMVQILAFDEDELDADANTPLGRANNSIALLTLGHEIGHHLCRHLTDRKLPPWEQELEADQVGGAILAQSSWRGFFRGAEKRLELEDFLDAGRRVLGDEQGSETHPPLAKRLEAIRQGWNSQSPEDALGNCAVKPELTKGRARKP